MALETEVKNVRNEQAELRGAVGLLKWGVPIMVAQGLTILLFVIGVYVKMKP